MTKKSRENEEGQMNQSLTLDFAEKILVKTEEVKFKSLDFVIQFTILPKNSRKNGGGQILFILRDH